MANSGSVATILRAAAALGACLCLANCASSNKLSSRVDPKYGVSSSPRVVAFGEPVPKGGGTYRVGKPYAVAGRTYVPEENPRYRAEGLASWYGDDFHGRLTANGEVFDMTSLTAAHPTLPIPSYARVTNLANGKSLVVRVNDRGPYHGNRLIDVSSRAAQLLEFQGRGIAHVRVEYVARAPLEGSDDRQLVATLRTNQPAPAPSAVRIASAEPFIPELRRVDDLRAAPNRRDSVSFDEAPVSARAAIETTEIPRIARSDMAPPPSLRGASYDLQLSTERRASAVPLGSADRGKPRDIGELLQGRGLY